MGNLASLSIALEGAFLAILSIMAGLGARTAVERALAALWFLQAVVDVSLLLFPKLALWPDYAPYWVFISIMAFIGLWQRGWFHKTNPLR